MIFKGILLLVKVVTTYILIVMHFTFFCPGKIPVASFRAIAIFQSTSVFSKITFQNCLS